MSDTFNDGDPIDATLLQKLKTDVATATALANTKVSAGSNINVDPRTAPPAEITVPTFWAGKTGSKKVTIGKVTTYTLNYTAAGFSKAPSAITLTPIAEQGYADIKAPSIVRGTVTEKSAIVQILGSGSEKSIEIYYIAVVR
jgi:hypothetical protein